MEFVDLSEESVAEESVVEESVVEESVVEESVVEESVVEESVVEESVVEESLVEESSPEETQAPAELYFAEVVQSIDSLTADLEHTNLILMSFFVVFCVVSLRNIVFGIRKNIFGR